MGYSESSYQTDNAYQILFLNHIILTHSSLF